MMEQTVEDSESTEISSKTSYLPSWVTRMRSKIEESRIAHSDAENRLTQISFEVNSLTTRIDALRRDDSAKNSKQIVSSLDSTKSKHPVEERKKYLKIALLPSDVVNNLLQYLELHGIFSLASSSKELKGYVTVNPFWIYAYRKYYSFLRISTIDSNLKHREVPGYSSLLCEDISQQICTYLQQKHRCFFFLSHLKEQRSVPKHNSVLPRRYSRADNSITHPLPLLLQSKGQRTELVMSLSETLNSDFRSLAHSALQLMIKLTCDMIGEFCLRLVEEGVVTVLLSLLSNEEGSVQNYSCHILANLLHWDQTCAEASHGVGTQLMACQGNRQLMTLLTSPSASVNLTIAKSPQAPVGGLDKATGSSKSTASVQGVCNKHASRALVCLYFPEGGVRAQGVFTCPSSAPPVPYTGLSLPYQFTYFYKSGALKDSFSMVIEIREGKEVRGQGGDSIGGFSLLGHIERDIVGYVLILHKTYHREEDSRRGGGGAIGAHVSHVAYFACGEGGSVSTSYCTEEEGLRSGLGFWGVWETNSGQSHFDLQKGGVFRAMPLL